MPPPPSTSDCPLIRVQENWGRLSNFLEFLARDYPHLACGYGRLYAGKYASESYAERFRTVMGILKTKYDLRQHREARANPPPRSVVTPTRRASSR